MVARSNRWLKLFEKFSADLRIKSKEAVTQDDRGAKLDMWDSQKRFMRELGQGLDEGIHTFNALKSRQLGITTISPALVDVFWPAMHPNMIGCLVTDTEKNREANRALIEGFINSFPDDYFGESFRIVKGNRQLRRCRGPQVARGRFCPVQSKPSFRLRIDGEGNEPLAHEMDERPQRSDAAV